MSRSDKRVLVIELSSGRKIYVLHTRYYLHIAVYLRISHAYFTWFSFFRFSAQVEYGLSVTH